MTCIIFCCHRSLLREQVTGDHGTQVVTKASGLKTLARSIGRKNQASIARQVMKDPRIKEKVLEILAKHVQKEMTVMCSRNTGSVLRSTAPDVLKRFTWETVVAEVQAHAPTRSRC